LAEGPPARRKIVWDDYDHPQKWFGHESFFSFFGLAAESSFAGKMNYRQPLTDGNLRTANFVFNDRVKASVLGHFYIN